MFSRSAELYDQIYRQIKDYEGESRRVAELLGRLHPDARTVLDVGCGTGEHARHLARDHGYDVDGLDVEPDFVRLARHKHPEGSFACADMMDFDLGRRYDAVLCLFSAIGYVKTLENVERALRRFRAHLADGGVVVLEPWIEPDTWRAGRIYLHTAESEEVTVCRMSLSARRGRLSVIEFHYLVGRGEGIEHMTETHELGLFTREELERCFHAAGFTGVDYDPEGLIGRGLFTARAGESS
jgi:SAM-dependent methyltransferase